MVFTNSPLVDFTRYSPNNSGRRNHNIDTISIHCMAGNLSVESCGALFADPDREASSNYGIGSDGRIGLYVDEANRSWCTSSSSNDNRAVTIEVANIETKEPYRITEKAWDSLIALCADICKRNGIKKLLWQADPNLIGQVDKQNMTVHRWFANKSCPGNWLYANQGRIADEVNELLEEGEEEMTQEQFNEMFKVAMASYRKGLQDNDAGSWSKDAREWAVNSGLIQGGNPLPSGLPNFMWEDLLTREQMATLLYRFKNLENLPK